MASKLVIDDTAYETEVPENSLKRGRPAADPELIKAFIPGTIVAVRTKVGERVREGDALLLLAAVLDKNSLLSCLREAEGLNLACLVEIHNESELDMALTLGAEIVGINNRDLRTFETSSEVTKRLAPLSPSEILLVAESGIKTKSDLVELASYGIDAALIGEALVTSHAPVELLQEFTGIRKRGFLHG